MIDVTANLATFTSMPRGRTQQVWCEWLRRHSIDPMDVAVPGSITRYEDTRRVTYLAWHIGRDDNGRLTGDVNHVSCTVQLEAEPLPFPEVTQ